jgi:hypothetical protein
MRHPAPTPAESPFPLPRDRNARRDLDAPVHPDAESVARFNALVHELYRDAPQIDANAIASVARWLDAQPPDQREQLLNARLVRSTPRRNDASTWCWHTWRPRKT